MTSYLNHPVLNEMLATKCCSEISIGRSFRLYMSLCEDYRVHYVDWRADEDLGIIYILTSNKKPIKPVSHVHRQDEASLAENIEKKILPISPVHESDYEFVKETGGDVGAKCPILSNNDDETKLEPCTSDQKYDAVRDRTLSDSCTNEEFTEKRTNDAEAPNNSLPGENSVKSTGIHSVSAVAFGHRPTDAINETSAKLEPRQTEVACRNLSILGDVDTIKCAQDMADENVEVVCFPMDGAYRLSANTMTKFQEMVNKFYPHAKISLVPIEHWLVLGNYAASNIVDDSCDSILPPTKRRRRFIPKSVLKSNTSTDQASGSSNVVCFPEAYQTESMKQCQHKTDNCSTAGSLDRPEAVESQVPGLVCYPEAYFLARCSSSKEALQEGGENMDCTEDRLLDQAADVRKNTPPLIDQLAAGWSSNATESWD